MSRGERPLPLWPEGLRKERNLPPVENQRRAIPSRGDTSVVPKKEEGTRPLQEKRVGSRVPQLERQTEQAINAILPSYIREMDSDDRERITYKLVPDKELLKKMGWDNFAELSLDLSSLLPKPPDPFFTSDNPNQWLSERLPANVWEDIVAANLEAQGASHLIPQFKEHMQEYRNAVKATVQAQRDQGFL